MQPTISRIVTIYFGIVFLLLSYKANSQIIYKENFETSLASSGWSIYHLFGGSWLVQSNPGSSHSGTGYLFAYGNSQATDSWAFSPAQNLSAGTSYRLSYWYKRGTAAAGNIKVTAGQGAEPINQTITISQQTGLTNDEYMESVAVFSVPVSGNYNLGIQNFSSAYGPELMIDSLVLMPDSVCTGSPLPGMITGSNTYCTGENVKLRLFGDYTASGLSFQWQSSASGAANDFTSIGGAIGKSISIAQSTATYYRCLVSCINGQTAATPVYAVTDSVCYCIPSGGCEYGRMITNIKFGSINNSSGCGIAGYSDFSATVYPSTINTGTTVPISVSFYSLGLNSAGMWIDFNRNGIFEETEFTSIASAQLSNAQMSYRTIGRNIYFPTALDGGYYRMRVRLLQNAYIQAGDACTYSSYGETEDYMLNLTQSKVSIQYNGHFTDTPYTNKIKFRAQIRQTDIGIDTSASFKPKIWARSYNTTVGLKSFQGNLIAGTVNNGTWEFEIDHDTLGVVRNGCDAIMYYFVAQDLNTPFNLGYYPELGTQHSNVNTVIATPTTPIVYRLVPKLKDTVYVGNNNCRYQSLSGDQSLFNDINTRGLEGDLTIIIKTDLAEETGQFELNGSAMNNFKILIRPDTNTIRNIGGIGQQKTWIRLNAVKNLTIDGSFNGSGRYLRFYNYVPSPTGAVDTLGCIKISNSSENIELKNIHFQVVPGTADDQYMRAVLITGGFNKNIRIINNLFREQYSLLPQTYIESRSGNNQILIRNNDFVNFSKIAVVLESPASNCVIDSNHFYRTITPPASQTDAGAINVSGGGHRISRNFIGGSARFAAGQPMRFLFYPVADISMIKIQGSLGAVADTVVGNSINNINVDHSYMARSKSFYAISNTQSEAIISNNIIGNPLSDTATIVIRAESAMGIFSMSDKNVNITGNTVCAMRQSTTDGLALMAGIHLKMFNNNTTPGPDFEVSKNKIFNLSNLHNEYDFNGIEVRGGSNNQIYENEIYNLTINYKTLNGIRYDGFSNNLNTQIKNNRIYELMNTSTAVGCCGNTFDEGFGRITGIRYANVNGSMQVYNNQISLDNNMQVLPVNMRGIDVQYSNNDQIIYNSIYIGGISSNVAGSATIHSSGKVPQLVKNNFLYNERTGGTKGHFIYRFYSMNENQFGNLKSRTNLYVVSDTFKFARLDESVTYGWSAWKSKALNDSFNYLTNPVFIPSGNIFTDLSQADMHINVNDNRSWYVNGKGTPVEDIAADIDSAAIRSISIATGATDIGADEFDTNTIPPELIIYGRHEPGGADTLLINGRITAIIHWENQGVLPQLGQCRYYSGEWPNDSSNGGLNHNSKPFNAWWHIPATGGNGYAYRITVFFDSSMLGKANNIPAIAINKKTEGINGTWQMILPTTFNANSSVTSGLLTSFSEFSIADISNPLGLRVAGTCAGGNMQIDSYQAAAGNLYQWQVDEGTGYSDLSNNSYYSDVHTAVLNVTTLPATYAHNLYRCRIINGTDTTYSDPVQLKIINEWIGSTDTNWFNAVNWSCGSVPDSNTDVLLKANAIFYPVLTSSTSCRSLQIYSGANIELQNGATLSITGK